MTTFALDSKAPVKARAATTVQAPAAVVWEVLATPAAWPDWYRDLRQVDAPEGVVGDGATFTFKTGPVQIEARVEEAVPGSRFAFTGKSRGANAAYVFDFREENGTTVVEAAQTMSGMAVTAMKPMLQKIADTSLVAWVENLRERCAGGAGGTGRDA